MSRYFSARHEKLVAYVPGEQPRNQVFTKLNTNESPYPPAPLVEQRVREKVELLRLYNDPECTELRRQVSRVLGVPADCVLMTNGSDEALNFAIMAYGDESHPFQFANITYGFYPVFCDLNRVPYREIPLREDFSLNVEDYLGNDAHIIIANPNAPTGMALPLTEIERILRANPDVIVVVDEAYVDFGGESAAGLVEQYRNLIVTRTFSKSYSLAGARLGIVIACPELIADLHTMKDSTNPYNVNMLTQAAGISALEENDYYMNNCARIRETRDWTKEQLEKLGFAVLPSCANFLFARHQTMSGAEVQQKLRENGYLVRHFTLDAIKDFNRISIGTREQMEGMIEALGRILQ